MGAVMWSASELLVITISTLVFFSCLGFCVWKALSAAQANLYWHISLCMIWFGIVIAAIAGSRTEVWTTVVIIGYGMLTIGILMTLAGMMCEIMNYFAMYRDRSQHRIR